MEIDDEKEIVFEALNELFDQSEVRVERYLGNKLADLPEAKEWEKWSPERLEKELRSFMQRLAARYIPTSGMFQANVRKAFIFSGRFYQELTAEKVGNDLFERFKRIVYCFCKHPSAYQEQEKIFINNFCLAANGFQGQCGADELAQMQSAIEDMEVRLGLGKEEGGNVVRNKVHCLVMQYLKSEFDKFYRRYGFEGDKENRRNYQRLWGRFKETGVVDLKGHTLSINSQIYELVHYIRRELEALSLANKVFAQMLAKEMAIQVSGKEDGQETMVSPFIIGDLTHEGYSGFNELMLLRGRDDVVCLKIKATIQFLAKLEIIEVKVDMPSVEDQYEGILDDVCRLEESFEGEFDDWMQAYILKMKKDKKIALCLKLSRSRNTKLLRCLLFDEVKEIIGERDLIIAAQDELSKRNFDFLDRLWKKVPIEYFAFCNWQGISLLEVVLQTKDLERINMVLSRIQKEAEMGFAYSLMIDKAFLRAVNRNCIGVDELLSLADTHPGLCFVGYISNAMRKLDIDSQNYFRMKELVERMPEHIFVDVMYQIGKKLEQWLRTDGIEDIRCFVFMIMNRLKDTSQGRSFISSYRTSRNECFLVLAVQCNFDGLVSSLLPCFDLDRKAKALYEAIMTRKDDMASIIKTDCLEKEFQQIIVQVLRNVFSGFNFLGQRMTIVELLLNDLPKTIFGRIDGRCLLADIISYSKDWQWEVRDLLNYLNQTEDGRKVLKGSVDEEERSVLMWAIELKKYLLVGHMIETFEPEILVKVDKRGRSALDLVRSEDGWQEKQVAVCIAEKLSVEVLAELKGEAGQNELMRAITMKNESLAKAILLKMAEKDLLLTDTKGKTALRLAMENDLFDIALEIIRRLDFSKLDLQGLEVAKLLLRALDSGDIDLVRQLIMHSFQIELQVIPKTSFPARFSCCCITAPGQYLSMERSDKLKVYFEVIEDSKNLVQLKEALKQANAELRRWQPDRSKNPF
jgi:hypothetical protein